MLSIYYVDPSEIYPGWSVKAERIVSGRAVQWHQRLRGSAAQGLMAGINVLLVGKQGSVVLSRSEAYIGVLIDDL
jgi:hypothetical protein